jgi:thioredoxin
MKRSSYLFAAILSVFVLSCNGQSNKESTAQVVQTSEKTRINSLQTDASPVHITKDQFLTLVMDYEKNPEVWQFQGEKPCLIDFYADWCAPCRITSPILEDLAKQYAGKINVYKIDIEKEQELAAVFGVQSIPTFLFCPLDGKPTISSGIANTPDATRQMFIKQIEQLLLKNKETSPAI